MPVIGAAAFAFAFFVLRLSDPPPIACQLFTRCSALLHATACSVSVGLLPPCETSVEPPMITRFGTSCAIPKSGLGRGAFVDRYRVGDGEGTFTMCTLWLVLALTQIGAVDE